MVRKICKKILFKICLQFCTIREYIWLKFFHTPLLVSGNFCNKQYFINPGEPLKSISSLFTEAFADKFEKKIFEANLVCEHVFDLLGSGPVKLNSPTKSYQPIDWHCDFKAGHRWNPRKFYAFIRYGTTTGADIKVPWELSRFQHLNILGQAYCLTGEERYVQEFVNQIGDWIENNPVGFGVNWACTMDVAIRAANWLVAQEYFAHEENILKSFWKVFYQSIYEHGVFIRNHLENHNCKTNHYIANVAGLFFISVYCPFFEESVAWQEFALQELTREMEEQVYEDGCTFEASTAYHRLVLEMFFYCCLLAERDGKSFSDRFKNKLRKMFEASLYCIKPDGRIPQIGDNDNGRFLTFTERPVLEHSYLLAIAAVYYNDQTFKTKKESADEELLWIFGREGLNTWNRLSARKEKLSSRSFPYAGWHVMRYDDNYCLISCGPNGQHGEGGHAHNDKLSFTLMLNGEDVIVDPGTYVYTADPEWRNKFRSTLFHNTVMIGDIEQNDISKDLFMTFQNYDFIYNNFAETYEEIIFEGHIRYKNNNIRHWRKIVLNKRHNSFTIIDNVTNSEAQKVLLNLCLGSSEKKYKIVSEGIPLDRIDGFFSPEYGMIKKTTFLRGTTEPRTLFKNKIIICAKEANGK